MPIVVARHAGFCMGVHRAVNKALETADLAQQEQLPCRTLGDLIHNTSVVSMLRAKGVHPVSTPNEAEGGILILRSHGVSPELLDASLKSARKVVDCTCPFVHRLHRVVSEFSTGGAPVILVGDRDHPEIRGTAGWCHGEVYVVSSPEEVASLPESASQALLVSQTTFPPTRWEELVLVLTERFPLLRVERTICQATALRQREAQKLASQADCMVVVGSRRSANTRELYHACARLCKRTYLVECAADLPPHFGIPHKEFIGVTAGASTPGWSLKEVIDSMNDMERNGQSMQPEITTDAVPQSDEASAFDASGSAPAAENGSAVADSDDIMAAPQPESPAPDEASQPEENDAEPSDAHGNGEEESELEEPSHEKSVSFMDEVAANIASIHNGQTVTGKVVQITDDEISVNIGYKTDGLIRRSDLVDQELKLGDEVMVEILKVNDGEGNVILSQRNIVNRKVWDDLMEKYDAGEFVDAVGKEAVKGGLLASMNGVRAFVPASHLAQRYVDKISQFVGQPMRLKIIEVDKTKKRVVASRKEVLIAEGEERKAAAWARLSEGAVVRGIVRRFASFGAFVDLDGVDGLIHITDLSWNRSVAPSDVLKANQEVEVKILSLDRERERIQLGYKQLQPKPWDDIENRYQVGSIIIRKVVRIRPFGAFVEIEPGVDGLVHISQVALTRINKVEDVLSPGQEVRVKILSIDPDAKRISLSIREALEDYAFDYGTELPGDDMADPATPDDAYAYSVMDGAESEPAYTNVAEYSAAQNSMDETQNTVAEAAMTEPEELSPEADDAEVSTEDDGTKDDTAETPVEDNSAEVDPVGAPCDSAETPVEDDDDAQGSPNPSESDPL